MIVVTNNIEVKREYESKADLRFVEGGYKDVLAAVRDLVHQGHKLITHPLMGSLKPNETPYRSVAITSAKGKLDLESLGYIEEAMACFDRFQERPLRGTNAPEEMLEDFRLIDLSLLASGLKD